VQLEIVFVGADGSRRSVAAKPGQSVMQAAVDAGIDGIAADCGGCLTCATCHVFVAEPARFEPPTADEVSMLEMTATPTTAASRLSCQLRLTEGHDGLEVRLPATQY
jgi:ferredoxin, 2Fe-2S